VAVGAYSLLSNTGKHNVALGAESLFYNTTGDDNVAVGYDALGSNTTGVKNVAVGQGALTHITTKNNNIGIGHNAQVSVASNSNQVRIGNASIGQSSIQVDWSISSDLHWKDSVETLAYGLNLIKELRPVSYLRKGAFERKREIGFIAQELDVTLRKIGYHDQGFLTKTDSGYFEVRYNDFIGIAVNAIKEQQQTIEGQQQFLESQKKTNDNQQQIIEDLQKEMLEMKKRLAQLEDQIK
jgi:hypothetical protein